MIPTRTMMGESATSWLILTNPFFRHFSKTKLKISQLGIRKRYPRYQFTPLSTSRSKSRPMIVFLQSKTWTLIEARLESNQQLGQQIRKTSVHLIQRVQFPPKEPFRALIQLWIGREAAIRQKRGTGQSTPLLYLKADITSLFMVILTFFDKMIDSKFNCNNDTTTFIMPNVSQIIQKIEINSQKVQNEIT